MTNKSKARKGRASKLGLLLMGFFGLAMTAVFAVSIANTTFAEGSMQTGQDKNVTGEVVSIDNLHDLRMVTLRSESIGTFPNDRLNIFVNKNTKVEVCNAREPFKDIGIDRNATVTYHEVKGLLPVADSISEKC